MSENPIRLTVPTSRAWARMKRILFAPFDLGKWFVLGFTAWLATLFEGVGGSGGSGDYSDTDSDDSDNIETGEGGGDFDLEEFKSAAVEFYDMAITWIQDNPGITMLIGGLILFVILFLIVLSWLSCRGEFMFLDNVVWNRARVSQPWGEYKRQGNSLFWWTLGFGIFVTLIVVAFLGVSGWTLLGIIEGDEFALPLFLPLIGIGIVFFVFVFVLAYIGVLLEDFVIPVMYEYKLTTTEAWMRFLPLHNSRFFRFALYAIWKLLLGIVAGIALVAFAFGTCCIGLIILAIPYIGAVLLLPVTVFFRSLGPEFLAQFGDEWDLFDEEPPAIA